MGFTGSFVVCRSDRALDEIEALTSRDDAVEWQTGFPSGWRVGRYPGTGIVQDVVGMLRDLVTETGAPALTGWVFDSDYVDVIGYGPQSGWWHVALAPDAADGYLADDDIEFEDGFPDQEQAVERAEAWAREAGLQPDPSGLRKLFDAEADPLAEDLFTSLVEVLGFTR